MTDPGRPFVLECWELKTGTQEFHWAVWSTTAREENALRIRDRLLTKGYQARVRNSQTGVISGEKEEPVAMSSLCGHCDEIHPKPFDGSCLL